MLTNQTIEGLHALRLPAMAAGLAEQAARPPTRASASRSASGCWSTGSSPSARTAGWPATSRRPSCAATPWWRTSTSADPRGLDRAAVLGLAEGGWVAAHHNIAVVGPTGVGKTFLACALANAAIRRGHSALYLRARRMLDELAIARADGRLVRALRHVGPRRRAGDRRLPAPAAQRRPGRRHPRGHRGPGRAALHDRHQPAARRPVARGHGRAHRRRRRAGPGPGATCTASSSRASPCAGRRAPTAGAEPPRGRSRARAQPDTRTGQGR